MVETEHKYPSPNKENKNHLERKRQIKYLTIVVVYDDTTTRIFISNIVPMYGVWDFPPISFLPYIVVFVC